MKISSYISNDLYITKLKDSYFGEIIVLVIESEKYCEAEYNELISDLKSVCLKFEIPKKILFFNNLNRTENGKLKRNDIL